MRNFERVKFTLLFVCMISIVFASCQDVIEQNETKSVGLQDPNVDATVKSALENGTVSEVVVRKDLLLFPVNAPNLVIAHSQEIHAVPQNNGTNNTDGKPTAAQVAEVNEYSLSQLVNDTDNNNETVPQSFSIPASAFSYDPQNDSVLEPGKLLEIVSGFNLSNGLVTEKVSLPDEVQNISLPKQSIVDLLSKSLPQNASMTTTATETSSYYAIVKRSADSDEIEKDDSSNFSDSSSTEDSNDDSDDTSNSTSVEKRSVDSEEDKSDSSDTNDAKQNDKASSTTQSNNSNRTDVKKRSVDSDEEKHDDSDSKEIEHNDSSSNNTDDMNTTSSSMEIAKRSTDSDEDDDSISNSTEYYDHVVISSSSVLKSDSRPSELSPAFQVDNTPEGLTNSTISSSITHRQESISEGVSLNEMTAGKESLREDSREDMDVAEDIVFRPLFRYRQETRLRQQYHPYRRLNNRRPYYDTDNSDYD